MVETETEEEEEHNEEGNRDGETPLGHSQRWSALGGGMPPWKKTRTYLTLPQNVSICCYGEYIETTLITTMGHTWTSESRTTLSDSVIVAG